MATFIIPNIDTLMATLDKYYTGKKFLILPGKKFLILSLRYAGPNIDAVL